MDFEVNASARTKQTAGDFLQAHIARPSVVVMLGSQLGFETLFGKNQQLTYRGTQSTFPVFCFLSSARQYSAGAYSKIIVRTSAGNERLNRVEECCRSTSFSIGHEASEGSYGL